MLTASVTLATAGSYLIFASVRLDFNVATFNSPESATLKLRETANGPADLANAVRVLNTGSPTAESETFFAGEIPPVIYAAQAGDVIQIFGSLSDTPYTGSVDAIEASILAIKLF